MRLPWRLLLLRAHVGPWARVSVHHSFSEVESLRDLESLRSFTSFLHLHGTLSPSQPIFCSHLANYTEPRSSIIRSFSSEPAPETNDSDHAVISNIFSKPRNLDEIRKDLESNNIVISHDLILGVLIELESSPDVARRFFDWVLACEDQKLSSKSYNLMLSIMGINGFVSEFWGLVETMKKKGYGISKSVQSRALEQFEKEGLNGDVDKLKGVFASGSVDRSDEKICLRVYRIVRNEVWGDNVEKQLRDLNVTFSSDMVKMVLDKLSTEPMKALILFRWLDESGLFKHDQQTYNAMAKILGREDCIDRFWKVIDEMKNAHFEMEEETLIVVLGRFYDRKMIEEAVNLYECAMAGRNKPSGGSVVFLLRKIVTSKKLDMALFSRAVRIFTSSGYVLTDSTFDAVLKSLTSVGRIGECTKSLKAMEEEGGYVMSDNVRGKIVFQLSCAGKKDKANEFVDNMEVSGYNPDWKTWKTLIEGLCAAGNLDKASDCLKKMVESGDVRSVGSVLDLVVAAYCRRSKAMNAYKLLNGLVCEKQVKPQRRTCEMLITKLLAQGEGGFRDALHVLESMKSHEFPPVVDPFIEYVSKSGTGEDAIAFLKAMTSKRFPSTYVFLRLFEAYFKAGRRNEAHNFLSQCPSDIRNHPDVLNLFLSATSRRGAATATTPVAV